MEGQADIPKMQLLRYMAGHRKAGAIIKKEKSARLQSLTADESFREYVALCETGKILSSEIASDNRKEQKLAFLIERREKFNKAGRNLL